MSHDLGRTLPVFPSDRVGWDAETERLSFGGAEYAMGDEVSAAGGYVSPPGSASIPASCEPDAWGDVMLIQDSRLDTMAERGY